MCYNDYTMRISSKKGDEGESGLSSGARAKKSELVFNALGDLDELNSALGWCAVAVESEGGVFKIILENVQSDLYRVMAFLGNEGSWPERVEEISEQDIMSLEENIERLENELGVLMKFIRPGTSEPSARLHLARSICRRAERSVVAYLDGKQAGRILKYLNRLSDFLFLMACREEKELKKE